MTETKKDFKLEKSLEQLVGAAGSSMGIKEASRSKVDLDLRRGAKNFYTNMNNNGIATNVNPNTFMALNADEFQALMEAGESEVYKTLDSKIEDKTYGEAKGFYTSGLDEAHKNHFYVKMLELGAMPKKLDDKAKDDEKKAYKALQAAKAEVDFVKEIKEALQKGDMDRARELTTRHTDAKEDELLAIYGGHSGTAFRGAEKGVYTAIANARLNRAMHMIKENNLYGLIDKGIGEMENGKAYSLVEMYKLYNNQLEVNKAKAEAEKKASGGK